MVLALSFGAQAVTNTVLFVNEYGAVSSTNAFVTQAQIAAVTASNQLVLAKMEAAEAGYNAALALLSDVANSMSADPIVFFGPMVAGFDSAVAFSADARLNIVGWTDTNETDTKSVGGESLLCKRWVMRFVFTDPQNPSASLAGLQPLAAYNTNCTGRAEWDDLNPALVGAPALDSTPYSSGGVTYANTYLMDVWMPARTAGFVYVRVPEDAVSGDGQTMEFPGATGGFNGEMQIGTNAVEFVNGVAYPAAGGVE